MMGNNLLPAVQIGLVDDHASFRRALGRLLRSHGYRYIPYDCAESALADPEFLKMDCLILDIELRDMDGFQLRDHLREIGAAIPHIFVTGHTESDFPNWAAQIGDSPFLVKPVEEQQLFSLIDKLLRNSRLQNG